MELSLLPGADESVACAAHARHHAVDPGGTAIRADLLIAVEVPLPWPKPVFDHPWLRHLPTTSVDGEPTRVLAAVPARNDGTFEVVVARRLPHTISFERWLTDGESLRATVVSVVRGEVPECARPQPNEAKPEIWICTQGSHDRCCGSDGTRLAQLVAAHRDDVVVRRVSHTGGHRFAPTALSLPDGRMWAYLDIDAVDRIVDRVGSAMSVADRCRGWWGAETGPEQVAERAVFAAVGWGWDATSRHIETIDGPDHDGAMRFRVAGVDPAARLEVHEVAVGIARAMPTIACGAPGGLPAKPGFEYRVIEHCVVQDPIH